MFAPVKGVSEAIFVAEPVSRRDRLRAATVREIKDTARAMLVAEGPQGLTLRAIAREMGMSAPALYRYFPSRDELVEGLIAELFDEVSTGMETARDASPDDPVPLKLAAVSRAFRSWAVSHPAEFSLLFGNGIGGEARQPGRLQDEAGQRFGSIFSGLIAQIYLDKPFPIPADDEIDDALRAQLAEYGRKLPVPLPVGVTQVFLSCWIRLYGIVSMEAFGHLRFALEDVHPMFEAELRGLSELLGVADAYQPPPSRGGG